MTLNRFLDLLCVSLSISAWIAGNVALWPNLVWIVFGLPSCLWYFARLLSFFQKR